MVIFQEEKVCIISLSKSNIHVWFIIESHFIFIELLFVSNKVKLMSIIMFLVFSDDDHTDKKGRKFHYM
jgi:hypothetical protein